MTFSSCSDLVPLQSTYETNWQVFFLRATINHFNGHFTAPPIVVTLQASPYPCWWFQADGKLPKEQQRGYSSVFHALYRIAKEEGVLTYWKGGGTTGGLASPRTYFCVYGRLHATFDDDVGFSVAHYQYLIVRAVVCHVLVH